MSKNLFYETFHKNVSLQQKIIEKDNFTYNEIINFLEKNICFTKKKNILDLGCGSGTISFYMANKGNKVIGIDISQKAVNKCIESSKRLDLKNNTFFLNGDVSRFKNFFKKNTFDIVLCFEVVEHLSSCKSLFKNIFHILKSNGKFLISIPSSEAPLYKFGFLKKFEKKVGHLRRYSEKDLKQKLEQVGFNVISIKKTEGIFRNMLFVYDVFGILIKMANKFPTFGNVLSFVDKISLKLFGSSQVILLAEKP